MTSGFNLKLYERCHALHVVCLLKVHALDGDLGPTVLGDGGTFLRWGLVQGDEVLGTHPQKGLMEFLWNPEVVAHKQGVPKPDLVPSAHGHSCQAVAQPGVPYQKLNQFGCQILGFQPLKL